MRNDNQYIDRYLDGLLSEAESTAFEIRCLEDQAFFQRVKAREQERGDIARILRQADEEAFDLNRQSLFGRAGAWAATLFSSRPVWKWAVAAAAAVLVIFVILRPSDDTHPDWERELGVRTLRGPTVRVISPQIGGRIKQTIHFSWESELPAPFEAVFIDRNGKEVFSAANLKSGDRLDLPLEDGLYYWKLLHNGDWIYTGKFMTNS